MKRIALIILLITVVVPPCFSQVDTLWTRTFGGDYSESARSVIVASNEEILILGQTSSFGAGLADMYLVKTDAEGELLWSQTYGGAESDHGYEVIETEDGYLLLGYTKSFGAGDEDVYLVETDIDGEETWSRTYGETGSDMGWGICAVSSGGYAIVGTSDHETSGEYDVLVIRIDEAGEVLWEQVYGGIEADFGTSIAETVNATFVIAGCTGSWGAGNRDMYVLEIDADGSQLWQQTSGGGDYDWGNAITVASDDLCCVAVGHSSLHANDADNFSIAKFFTAGMVLYHRNFGISRFYDFARAVDETDDSGFLIAGMTRNITSSLPDLCIYKTDVEGYPQWHQVIGYDGSDWGESMARTADGGYVIAGHTNSRGAGQFDIWLVRLSSLNSEVDADPFAADEFYLSQNYPNPFNPSTTITCALASPQHVRLTVFNNLGREVMMIWNGELGAGHHEFHMDASNLPSGMYYYRLETPEQVTQRSMLLLK